MDDIAQQARQGSVAAIIQVLNEKLADSGVRTRAMFADGVLQLLCEAARIDQLEQSTLVQQIRQILEAIAPRNIRRVNINSRIVREQQLLWLEEINRDPENQLLWSEEITLVKPNPLKQLILDFKGRSTEGGKVSGFSNRRQQPLGKPVPKSQSSQRAVRQQNKLGQGIVGVASLCLFLLLGWAVYGWLWGKLKHPTPAETLNSLITPTTNQKNGEPSPLASTQSDDLFIAAVRIANLASASGKTAQTSTQWLDLAARWQRASDLMGAVPPNHSRYQEAQIRTKLYKKYSEAAQQQAQTQPS